MKKLRRLVTNPITKEIKMTTLYEYRAKVGTTGSTVVWLMEEAEKDKSVYGFCVDDHYSPYMGGHAFRYAPAERYIITDIQFRDDGYEFLFVNKG